MARKPLNAKLEQLRDEVHAVMSDGTQLTKGEALSILLWNIALGYEDVFYKKDPNDPTKQIRDVVYHKPQQWAIQMIYERLEGKVPNTAEEVDDRAPLADRVSELAVSRVNALAGVRPPLPPVHRRKRGADGS